MIDLSDSSWFLLAVFIVVVWWLIRTYIPSYASALDFLGLSLVVSLILLNTFIFLHRLENALSLSQFLKFFAAGGLCACITHAAFVPLDVIKTRLQTNPDKYSRIWPTLKHIYKEEGCLMLFQGFSATAIGYFLHGAFKFSFFEVFKALVTGTNKVQTPFVSFLVASVASILAETVASFSLCPMEAVRIRLVSEPSFARGFVDGLPKMWKGEGYRGLYKGLPYVLLKQIPYTYGQFVSYEVCMKLLSGTSISSSASKTVDLRLSVLCGLFSGIVAAVISQPGDTLLSLVNREGLGARMLLVACMLAGQFFIYDSLKALVGASSSLSSPPSTDENIITQISVHH
ncbi:Mitochondrial substrate carrier family protein N [Galdieria sulphuraria]|nr:Mitochondrial substrate carrier family protein N [Galdieria sulphuraria]